MSIVLRTVKGSALTYEQLDENLSQFYYSASLHNSGTRLRLHYTGSAGLSITPGYDEVVFPVTTNTLQSVTDTGNVTTNAMTALSFIKSGSTSDDVLLGDGTTTSLSGIGGSTDTGSLLTTASVNLNEITFTKGDSSTFTLDVNNTLQQITDNGSVTTNDIKVEVTGGFPVTTNYTEIKTGSIVIRVDDGSFTSATTLTGTIPGFGNSSNTILFPINDGTVALVSDIPSESSYISTASVNLNEITFTKGNSSTFSITVDTGSAGAGVDTIYSADGTIPAAVERVLSFGSNDSTLLITSGTQADGLFLYVSNNNIAMDFSGDEFSVATTDGNGINSSAGATTEILGTYGLQIRPGTGGSVVQPTVGQALIAIGTNGETAWGDYDYANLANLPTSVFETGSADPTIQTVYGTNTARASFSVVLGGNANDTTGEYSNIVGGLTNVISGGKSGISAGELNTIDSNFSFIGAGLQNTGSGEYSVIGGGIENQTLGSGSFIGGGGNFGGKYSGNTASGLVSTIAGGGNNTASGDESTVGGGYGNQAGALATTVAGGSANTATGSYSTVAGGSTNIASGSYSGILAGATNTARGQYSGILAGQSNSIQGGGIRSAILAGRDNEILASGSVILGGSNNDITANGNFSSVIAGNQITADRDITAFAGSVYVTGSTSVPSSSFAAVLQVARRETTPATPGEGMIINSGSAGNSDLWFYKGSVGGWVKLTPTI